MTSIFICALAFAVTYWRSRASLVDGIIATLTVGYFYGILRANLLADAAHFIFDASLGALYLSAFTSGLRAQGRPRSSAVDSWLMVLMAWPALLIFLPFQPLMVTLVGLRGNIFFLPVLAIGARLKNSDITKLTCAFATLNLAALGVGLAEYSMGIERFFPMSAVTAVMYASADAGGGHHRIPSVFANAHSYAGTMVYTLPWLLGAWVHRGRRAWYRILITAGLLAAFGGIMLASTRLNLVMGGLVVGVAIVAGSMSMRQKALWISVIAAAVMFASTNERFSRFKQLDSDTITERVSGSVNRTFFEVLYEHPMGNGLGGGGTSLPYFLMGLVQNPTVVENEYGRILLEQGIIGLILWLCFICWISFNRHPFEKTKWLIARRLTYTVVLVYFGVANIGLGMLTAIPGTFLFILMVGWIVTSPATDDDESQNLPGRRARVAAGAGSIRPEVYRHPAAATVPGV